MNPPGSALQVPDRSVYELRFLSLFNPGRGYVFPCDALGRVDLAAMSQAAQANYLRARSVIGRDFAAPRLQSRPMTLEEFAR